MDIQLILALGLVVLAIPMAWKQISRSWKQGDVEPHCDHCPANPTHDSDSSLGRM